jgi:ribosome recycling factor
MNNGIVRVQRPELTQEERDRRMKQIYKAAEAVLKEREKKRETHK